MKTYCPFPVAKPLCCVGRYVSTPSPERSQRQRYLFNLEKGYPMSTFHDLVMQSITGDAVKFSGYNGQACLVVNVASK